MATGPRTLNGKVVLQIYMLDNSMKTMLAEPTSTVKVRSWAGDGQLGRSLAGLTHGCG